MEAEELAGEAEDAAGARVVLPTRVWNDKLLRNHPELEAHLADVLRAVSEPITLPSIRSTRIADATT